MRMRDARARLGALAVAAALALGAAAEAVPLLSVQLGAQGSSAAVAVGVPVLVTIAAEGIPAGTDGNGLFGFGFSLSIGPGPSTLRAITLGSAWSGLQSISQGAGSLGVTANVFPAASGPSGSGIVLVSFVLDGLAAGTYQLALGPLTGPGDNVLFDGTELDATPGLFGAATLTVTEPALAALAAATLLALRARQG